MPVVPFGVLIATIGLASLMTGARRWQRVTAACAVALAVAHFAFFLNDYYRDYRGRSAFWFNRNHRAALETILARDAQSPAPAIYLTSSKDPYIAAYWEFALIKAGRRDLLGRTVYFDGETIDTATVAPGSLILMNTDDRRLVAQVAAGGLRRVADIQEPADPVFFTVLER
jgi:hypothetical protein